jgi:SAM-dependent methyltransferase
MAWDQVWDEVFQRQEWGKYPAEDLIRFVARNFYAAPNRSAVRLLEVGCGPGGNLWFMAREGFATYGVDGSPTAVTRATARLDAEIPGWIGAITVGDIMKLDFADESFDAVVDSEAIYCNAFEESVQIYAEARRVLRPGGLLFSRAFATGSLGDGTGEEIGRNYRLVSEGPAAGKGPCRFTAREDLPELLAGFDVQEVDLLSRAVGGDDTRAVREWLITARKR